MQQTADTLTVAPRPLAVALLRVDPGLPGELEGPYREPGRGSQTESTQT